jgi:ribosomal-protein-alanine N-acetyltransferase
MNMIAHLSTPRLLLYLPEPDLAQKVLNYHIKNHDFFKPWNPLRPNDYLTYEYHYTYLKNCLKNYIEQRELRLFMALKTEPELIIGDISCSNIVYGAFLSCHLGYKIDEDMRGKGLIPEALTSIIDYVFGILQLHRIEANIMPGNKASIRVVEKLGFTCEGLSPKYLKINGIWQDHLHYVLLNQHIE